LIISFLWTILIMAIIIMPFLWTILINMCCHTLYFKL